MAHSENGIHGLNVESFDLNEVVQDTDEGGMAVPAEALANWGQHIVIPLESGCISVLLAVKHEGCIWFVEQP